MSAPARGKVIVSGILFWYPLAGVTYQFLHYLIGLKRLGYDVYYVEDSGRWVYDPNLGDVTPDASGNVGVVARILEAYGFEGRWAFRGHYEGGACYGMTEQRILELYREAGALLNVTGAQELRAEHMGCGRRIYVESDPFAVQVRIAGGDDETIRAIEAHDVLFSFGENLGALDCSAPVGRFQWLPTRQPVVLDLWSNDLGAGSAYRTITTWSNAGNDVQYESDTYFWTKDREFLKFLDVPSRTRAAFEMAAGVDPDVRALLTGHGWLQLDSVGISRDPECYRRYIQTSRGEFTVARDQYVRPRTGWFSDRSACYLAAGRPVITQETGFSKYLPTGKGLFAFTTMDDVVAAVEAIERDYKGNCAAAREIAAEYFDAGKVLDSLMTRAGL